MAGTSSRLPMAERLRPSRLEDLIGNPRARAELRSWAERSARSASPSPPSRHPGGSSRGG